jgi:hypothetical protein
MGVVLTRSQSARGILDPLCFVAAASNSDDCTKKNRSVGSSFLPVRAEYPGLCGTHSVEPWLHILAKVGAKMLGG